MHDHRLAPPTRSDLDQLDPEILQRELGTLMRRYLGSRSAPMARAVAGHLEALCCHPEFFGSNDERCVYLRLVRQWRWLADQDTAAVLH
ncbi:ATP dependent RNA helicase [Thioalkalicoccus limnaeus]|uniref:ATP dependent RNA helicase n=1 Tax=Thioalkalicoccus limnaeus TaxID=120681 RepID=A0ABV4BGX3_9GAMM